MKNTSLREKLGRALPFSVVFGLFLFAFALQPLAQTTTFAQFIEQNGTQDFVLTNNSSSASFSTISGGSPISFRYQNISGLPAALTGFQDAHLTVTTTTTQTAALSGGSISQPLNQTVTIQITRDTPAPAGTGGGTRTNLLTVVFSPSVNTPEINGSEGGNIATMAATTPNHVVTFTSDFLSFASTTARNSSFSFSSVTPALSIDAGSFLRSFDAAATGTFASNPVPVYAPPTASSVALGGRVTTASGQAIRGAQVALTQADGTVLKTTTNSFGNFEFAGIEAGQIVTVEVVARRYSFAPRVVAVDEELRSLHLAADF